MIGNNKMKKLFLIFCLLIGIKSFAQKPVTLKLWLSEMPNQKVERAAFKSVLDRSFN
jgi:hypothetical protein